MSKAYFFPDGGHNIIASFSLITVGITLKFEIALMFDFVFVYISHCMCWQAPWREVGELLARTLLQANQMSATFASQLMSL